MDLIILLIAAGIIIILLLIWNLVLGKKVTATTGELTDALAQLRNSEERIRVLLVNLNVGIAVFSSEGDLVECNKRFFELGSGPNLSGLGLPLIEQSRRNQTLIKPPGQLPLEVIIQHFINEKGESLSKDEFPVNIVIASGKPLHGYIIGVKNPESGDIRWTLADLEPEFALSGQLSRIVVTLVDITEQKKAEKSLQENEDRLNAFLKVTPDLFFLFNREGKIIDFYLENTVIGKYKPSDYLGKTIPDFVDTDTATRAYQCIDTLMETGEMQSLEITKTVDGKDYFFEVRFVLCGQDQVLAVVQNISQRKETEAKFYRLSIHDPQTGLYNRTYFENELEKYQNEAASGMGLIICDIDGLKLINDTLGNSVGDVYLKTTADIFRQCLPKDSIIARIGDDEFSGFIKNSSIEDIAGIKLKIAHMLNTFNSQERLIPLSISLGFALENSLQKHIRELLRAAENVMYREKLHQRQSRKSKNIAILSKMLEARDFITEGHGDRMQKLSSRLAQAVGLSENEIKDMCLFAQFHDIGKIGIPDRILFKPGRLTNEEKNEMKRHTEIGYRIAESSPDLKHISDWILKHHEWWDGNGYPFKLKGVEIPLQCRILSIVDAYDAMTSNRPYRKALPKEDAINEILRCKGTQFDPWLVGRFMNLLIAS